ncbi:MAG: DUF4956 domain-containing protein [Sandaracinaceae bacterium]|nr:DUF4956 domain-containing protein [Sandaracinaceae bacterium]
MLDHLGFQSWIDVGDFAKLLSRLVVDVVFTMIVVHGVYRRIYGRNEFPFTYYALNVITFTICFLLRKVPTDLGFALGLFAVFGILRYRTEQVGIRDLTYLFVVIGIAIINATANKKVSVAELGLVNVAIVGMVVVLEFAPAGKREFTRRVIYDNLELLRAADKQALHADLSARLGVHVRRVGVVHADLLRDTAELTVYYVDDPPAPPPADQ